MNLFSLCRKPFGRERRDGENQETNGVLGGDDRLRREKKGFIWSRDIGNYGSGEFSMAVVQAYRTFEDQSQIESGQFGTFVGIYDGHWGPQAARYVCNNLFRHFRAITAESWGVVTAETIQRAFLQTEEGFTALVSELLSTKPNMARVGTCSLVGVIYKQTLFIANLGNSRVVLGKKVGNAGEMAAIQLSTEHDANIEAIRHELKELHPNDPEIVVLTSDGWKVKGLIQVSRSIGDVYLKHERCNWEEIIIIPPEVMNMPILSANPTIISHALHPNDSFLIFASSGLWKHLSNEQAVAIVHSHPRAGIAKRLVEAAIEEAAKKEEKEYWEPLVDPNFLRHFCDDITVIVLFFNHDLISRGAVQDPPLSIRSALEHR